MEVKMANGIVEVHGIDGLVALHCDGGDWTPAQLDQMAQDFEIKVVDNRGEFTETYLP